MASRRMLSKSISYSEQVNSLKEFTRLLFTWTIPHLDDFGRIAGNPKVLKAMVMPMSKKSVGRFEDAIKEMVDVGLIERYEVDGQQVIEYPKFDKYQTGLGKRTKSKYPENPGKSRKDKEISRISSLTEPNRTELNRTEDNSTELNLTEKISPDKNTDKKSPEIPYKSKVNPYSFIPTRDTEQIALEVWNRLDSENPNSFDFYLWAAKKIHPPELLSAFASEILQDKSIKNKGAVFVKKVKEHIQGVKSSI